MSISSKQTLTHEIERQLGSFLTVESVNEVMQVLSEQLSAYEVELTSNDISDAESGELLNAFLDAKKVEGRSDKTLERYRYCIQRVYDSVNVPIRKISVFHLRKYLSDEKARGIADSTLDGIRQILSAYFGWLQKEGLLKENPTANLGAIKSMKKIRKPYTAVDIEKLKQECASERDSAIISILLSTGCRISEICALNRDSIDFDNMEILILGKGNKERTVFINEVTAMHIKRYLDSRTDTHPALFIGKGTDRMHPGGIRMMLKRIAAKAGVENTHPHRFRRTLATNLIDHGMDIQEVAAILGHDKLDTTMKYVYVNKQNVKNSYQKYA